ncbi:hypothetical protein [Rhizobium leguminosarum]|uniref:hypothetical protein n=1 Tax=Rhizobium leguminosarum TaxID=384 RepID=UPI003F9B6163
MGDCLAFAAPEFEPTKEFGTQQRSNNSPPIFTGGLRCQVEAIGLGGFRSLVHEGIKEDPSFGLGHHGPEDLEIGTKPLTDEGGGFNGGLPPKLACLLSSSHSLSCFSCRFCAACSRLSLARSFCCLTVSQALRSFAVNFRNC